MTANIHESMISSSFNIIFVNSSSTFDSMDELFVFDSNFYTT